MMTQGTNEGFLEYNPNMRFTLFTRSSYIGSHRYTGVWLGDNHSWWSHLLQNLKWIPSMNMCGYLFTGSDLGGFNGDTTDELMLRWLQLGVFIPLMRNHSAWGTRQQELYRFAYREKMAKIVNIRYALIPYLYSEFMKAALSDESVYRPLAFDYPDDPRARQVEDQIMLGGECMLAPVYEQNAKGRYVYLPEDMLLVRMRSVADYEQIKLSKGDHWIDVDTDQLIFFIKKNRAIPIAKPAMRVRDIDPATIRMHGWLEQDCLYRLYDDDGLSKNVTLEQNIRILKAEA
jgi:alpha-glucosidase